ncbi:MAG: hypothetical protein ACSLEX_02295 [Minisyncoccota bacterium]
MKMQVIKGDVLQVPSTVVQTTISDGMFDGATGIALHYISGMTCLTSLVEVIVIRYETPTASVVELGEREVFIDLLALLRQGNQRNICDIVYQSLVEAVRHDIHGIIFSTLNIADMGNALNNITLVDVIEQILKALHLFFHQYPATTLKEIKTGVWNSQITHISQRHHKVLH